MRPSRLDVLMAAGLSVAGALEMVLAGDSPLTLVAATIALAWRRRAPLASLIAIALALTLGRALGGDPTAHLTPMIVLVLSLYSMGRHGSHAAPAALVMAGLAATRIALDPRVDGAADVVLTLVYLPVPFLVGRWLRAQALLRDELQAKAKQLERAREQRTRCAAEEERVRIAADLQSAVTGELAIIVREARRLPGALSAQDAAAAQALLEAIADRARGALADVRRILGILRRDMPPPRTPAQSRTARVLLGPAAPASDLPAVDDSSGPTSRPDPRRRRGLDLALVAGLMLGAEIELAVAAPGALAALTALLVPVPLLWRRSHPLLAGAGVLAAIALQSTVLGLDRFPISDAAAVVCAAFSAGVAGRAAGLALIAFGSGLHSAIFYPDAVLPAVVGGAVVPWIVGRTTRGRRLLSLALDERARRIEQVRAQEARAAMTAERSRVARELHDAVAHNLSVVAVQAAGAAGIVERDAAQAAHCAALIEAAANEALAELGVLVDAREAARTLAHVDDLTDRTRATGLPVELRVEGAPDGLPAGIDLAAYRIVQEALANTTKHAGAARAWVVVRYEPHAVEVEVADDGCGPGGGAGGGHGLVGIRERVALYDGELAVGRRPAGGFRVHARLPIA